MVITTLTPSTGWVTTADGSLSWYDAPLNELSHNRAGAYAEAMIQYVTPLLNRCDAAQTDITVLDAFFGLGYNTWVLMQQWLSTRCHVNQPIHIHTWGVELDTSMWQKSLIVLNQPCFQYLNHILNTSEHKIYYQTQYGVSLPYHLQPGRAWQTALNDIFSQGLWHTITWHVSGPWGQCQLNWLHGDLLATLATWQNELTKDKPQTLHAVFHDAYCWRKVPQLWATEVFLQYKVLLTPRSCVLTYSRASKVKNAFIEAGYKLIDTPSLGGKKGGVGALLN